jgi:hypothetical protein
LIIVIAHIKSRMEQRLSVRLESIVPTKDPMDWRYRLNFMTVVFAEREQVTVQINGVIYVEE